MMSTKNTQEQLEEYIYFDTMDKQQLHGKLDMLIEMQTKSNDKIDKLEKDTSQLLDVWDTTVKVGKFLAFLGRVGKWVGSITLLGGSMTWIYTMLKVKGH